MAAVPSSSSRLLLPDPNKRRYLPVKFLPSVNDVLCGKGKTCFNHPGNRRFRAIVGANLHRYQTAPNKIEKSAIVNEIVDIVRKHCSTMGGFVRPDTTTKRWFEIGDEAAREKVGQVIRDTILRQNPQGMEEKQRKRKARASERKERNAMPPYISRDPDQPLGLSQSPPSSLGAATHMYGHRPVVVSTKSVKQDKPLSKVLPTMPHILPIQSFMRFGSASTKPTPMLSVALVKPEATAAKKKALAKGKRGSLKKKPQAKKAVQDEPITDFYAQLCHLYRPSSDESDDTSASTYSGKDTADEMSCLSDDEEMVGDDRTQEISL
jgi:hypothetical protein